MRYLRHWDTKLILLWIAAFANLASAAVAMALIRAGVWIICATVVSALKVGSMLRPRALFGSVDTPSRI